MGDYVVIVESPAKARTLGRYLGKGYKVKASMGHVLDLPRKKLGIEIEKDFEPQFEVIPDRKKTLTELRKAVKGAEKVFLAPDPDREGEAIAHHLKEALRLSKKRVRRVTFNEITKQAVQKAFEHPGEIDMNLVNAQQARRLLDRLVGYKLSPLLWRKIAKGLSAGRVQSVAVRLIVEREKEIEAFEPVEYWKAGVEVEPAAGGEEDRFETELKKIRGKPARLAGYDEAEAVRSAISGAPFKVAGVTEKQRSDAPKPPFHTSSLQQQASIRLRFSAKKTMMLAQQLYDGIDLGEQGPTGLITYMRTDSFRVANEALEACREHIRSTLGETFLSPKPNVYKSGKGAQAAHEAIRPTDVMRTPEVLKQHLKRDQLRLYRLIWERFVASQMAPARWAVTEITVEAGDHLFQTRGKRLLFQGHLKVWKEEKKTGAEARLPAVKEGDALRLRRIDLSQHFTQPPPRFTEATLVKTLEKEGIGRPSTYAPIISTIQDRGYVNLRERKFFATEIGKIVTDQLVEHFPRILDVDFTSKMEDDLDRIEEAEAEWTHVLKDFYDLFEKNLARAKDGMRDFKKDAKPSGETCEKCGGRLLYLVNKHGWFLGCENYPDCRTTVSLDEKGTPVRVRETEHKCPLCGKPMLLRTGRRGPFLGCSGYPECRNTVSVDEEGNPLWPEETGETCEKCGSPMVVKRGRRGPFLACTAYPACRSTRPLPGEKKKAPQETGDLCEKCGKPMVIRHGRRGSFAACSGYPACKNTKSLGPGKAKDKKGAKADGGE